MDLFTKTVEITVDGKRYVLSELSTGDVEAFNRVRKTDEGFAAMRGALLAALLPRHPDITPEQVARFSPRILNVMVSEAARLAESDSLAAEREEETKPGELKAV